MNSAIRMNEVHSSSRKVEDYSAYRILLIILLEGEYKVKMKRMGKCGNRLGYR
jgi:hypothetical protein